MLNPWEAGVAGAGGGRPDMAGYGAAARRGRRPEAEPAGAAGEGPRGGGVGATRQARRLAERVARAEAARAPAELDPRIRVAYGDVASWRLLETRRPDDPGAVDTTRLANEAAAAAVQAFQPRSLVLRWGRVVQETAEAWLAVVPRPGAVVLWGRALPAHSATTVVLLDYCFGRWARELLGTNPELVIGSEKRIIAIASERLKNNG